MGLGRKKEFHGAVDACTRIPPTALLHVLQTHLQQVLARLYELGDVDAEGIVAISPTACPLAVDRHYRL